MIKAWPTIHNASTASKAQPTNAKGNSLDKLMASASIGRKPQAHNQAGISTKQPLLKELRRKLQNVKTSNTKKQVGSTNKYLTTALP